MEIFNPEQVQRLAKFISDTSWAARNSFPRGTKFLSTGRIYGSMQKPKDWDEIARKCSVNPNHQHFGKTVEEIRALWSTKSDAGAYRGNVLDGYIKAKLSGESFVIPAEADDALKDKIKAFDAFYETSLSKLQYIGSEIWLNSKKGIGVRTDTLFLYKQSEEPVILVTDWKNTEVITSENRYEKLTGPLMDWDDCDLIKYSIQVYIYKWILQEEYKMTVPHVRIVQILRDKVNSIVPPFPYNAKLIEKVIDHAIKTAAEQAAAEAEAEKTKMANAVEAAIAAANA